MNRWCHRSRKLNQGPCVYVSSGCQTYGQRAKTSRPGCSIRSTFESKNLHKHFMFLVFFQTNISLKNIKYFLRFLNLDKHGLVILWLVRSGPPDVQSGCLWPVNQHEVVSLLCLCLVVVMSSSSSGVSTDEQKYSVVLKDKHKPLWVFIKSDLVIL